MIGELLIIIPTYNECENITLLIEVLERDYPQADILVIDDNSPDKTANIVRNLQNQYSNIRLLQRPKKMGLGTAYILGFRSAIEWGYKFVLEMDADFSHDPQYIAEILNNLQRFDLVIGSRYVTGGQTKNWSLPRKLLSYFGNLYARLILNIPIFDLTAGFVGIKVKLLKKINLTDISGVGYAFQNEIKYRLYQAGASIKEIPIIFVERRQGKSKMSGNIIREGFLMPWKIKFSRR